MSEADTGVLAATYATATNDAVAAFVAAQYDLPQPLECCLLQRDFNDSFAIRASDQSRYVLRMSGWRRRGDADVESETRFIAFLDSVGVPVAAEALVLAHGLWMIGPRMADLDAVLDQPDPERSERATWAVAPGRTVVGDQPLRQAVAAEGDDELLPDLLGPLVGTGCTHHGEARVIVEHGQGMKRVQGHVALEVHLPQLVWPCPLEAGEGGLAATVCAQLDPMPLQDRRHRRRRRNRFLPQILQSPGDLAAAPGRMLRTHREHCFLRHRSAARWRIPRTARQLLKPRHPFEPPTLQPLVAGRWADAEATAQLPNIRPFDRRQHHKFRSRVHPADLVERHPTASLIRCRKCPRCLRTPVHHVPGLNIFTGEGIGGLGRRSWWKNADAKHRLR